ncbi:hypothetical protein [Corynebacterium accolens]|uniref:Gp37-like protein n=1 Tax=Corynebacterium accolens TaxID=38284 RepID=UPI00266F541D|nr:hypothetical protein [Corynebacterium accolens]WKS54898.1 hypothetical protein NLL31_06615 [Corynebacterium accolens]
MSYESLKRIKQETFRNAAAPAPTVIALDPQGRNPVIVPQILRMKYKVVLNDVGQLSVRVPINDVMFSLFANAHPDASIPIVVQLGGMESMWFVTHTDEVWTRTDEYLELTAVSPEKHLEKLFGWPNPNLLPEFQISKIDLAAGPVARLIKEQLLAKNFRRMGKKTGGQVHYVAPTSSADNYTRMTIIGIKMDEVLGLIKSLINTEGLTLAYEVYLPGRGQTPPPGHGTDRAAIVWDVKQRAELPAGGLIWQGIVRSVKDFWKDAWATLTGFTDYGAENKAVDYWGKPQFMLRRDQYDDLTVTTVKPTASTYTVGGKTQDMLNDAISAAIKVMLQLIPPPFNILLDVLGLDDIVEDRLFAYHSFDDRSRRNRMGPFGFFETFNPSVGLSLDAIMLMRQAQYKSRATRSHEVSLGSSSSFAPGELLNVGSMIALELPEDRYAVSFVTEVNYDWTVAGDANLEFQIADRPRRDPQESMMRALTGVATLVNKAALAE